MNKKVCHMTSAHSRYDVRIFEKECRSLANCGYVVTLLVNDDEEDEVIDNIKILSTKFKPKNRIERFLKAGKIMYKKAVEIDADIYHLHDPDLIPLGNKLKGSNKTVIFDSHEDVPRQIIDKQWIPKIIRYFVSKLYETYERKSVKRFDAIISVTPHIVERFLAINPNVEMVTNYPIIDLNEDIVRKPERAICFAGGITEQWKHDRILMAIDQIDGIKYILAGKVSNAYMDMMKQLPGWNKVEYIGKVPHSEVKSIYSRSIAGMALNYSQQGKEYGTLGNTKLFEFMEAKLPVICSDYKLWRAIIDEYKCGICVNVNNVQEIKNAINYMLDNPDKARIMGENGRRAVIEKYNWATQEKTLLELYEKISQV